MVTAFMHPSIIPENLATIHVGEGVEKLIYPIVAWRRAMAPTGFCDLVPVIMYPRHVYLG